MVSVELRLCEKIWIPKHLPVLNWIYNVIIPYCAEVHLFMIVLRLAVWTLQVEGESMPVALQEKSEVKISVRLAQYLQNYIRELANLKIY